MNAMLPTCSSLDLRVDQTTLYLTFNRPEVRNALSATMWNEIAGVFTALNDNRAIRAVVMRGAGGTFCAGADLKERSAIEPPRQNESDPMWERNRMGGRILQKIDTAPQLIVSVVEGAAVGGGIGLLCVSDVVLATSTAKFALPEVSFGVLPAQIAPFLTRRLGHSQARRLALTGATLRGPEALAVGLIHCVCADTPQLNAALEQLLADVARCAPDAIAETKRLIALTGTVSIERHLDLASDAFTKAARGPEGVEGATAMRDKRRPCWVHRR